MGTFNFKGFVLRNKLKNVLIYVVTFILIYVLLITSLITKTYDIQEGSIAKFSIKAQRTTIDEFSTKAKKDEAVNLIPAQYSIDTGVKDTAVNMVSTLFSKAIQLKDVNLPDKDKITQLSSISNALLSEEDFGTLVKMDKEGLSNLESFLLSTLTEVYNFSIQYNPDVSAELNNENLKRAQDMVQLKFNSSNFPKATRDLGTNIGIKLIKPNSFYDKSKTEEMKNEAINKTAPVIIQKDQIIVMEGEQVTKEKYELLQSLGLLNSNNKSEWYIYTSLGIVIILLLFMEHFYIYKYHRDIYKDIKKLTLINLITVISLLLTKSLTIASPFLIPLAFAPLIISLLINNRISLTINIMNVIFISAATNFNIEITLLAIVNTFAGALIIKKQHQRNDIVYSSLYISVINVIATFSIGFLLSNNTKDVLTQAGFSAIGSGLSGILTIGLLPFFESIFDIVTTIKLLELSNPNNQLLKKLLMEAPGTYHHSILVANLAELACEEVGGNPALARVSAYYHDVGKIKRPYFFKENQMAVENPHDKITPNLSALIIISHVKDGIELAKDYKLPKIIQDIILSHHGTSLVKYFYVTAKNNSERPDEIIEEDFRYSGPIPQSKEAGIVMLADSIEAAVRSINEPNQDKIESMVNNIVKNILSEGQLDECDLTLKDITKIKKTFVNSLIGIYHKRVEYPEDKWALKTQDKI
jgi:putative nucleotidyltransferase with HDIG domain